MFPRQTDPEDRYKPALVCTKCGYRIPENWHLRNANWLPMVNREVGCVAGYDDPHDWEVNEGGDGE
jgi:hypothetical protein